MRTPIGSNMYLHTTGADMPTNIVISSHGGILATTDLFRTPVDLAFLGNTGESVARRLDDAIANFDFSDPGFEVENAETHVRDYTLSKFQGRHTQHKGKISHLWGKLTRSNNYEETYGSIEATIANYDDVGVLTIRNRKGKKARDVTLSEAVTAMSDRGATNIMCLFCRVHTVYEQVDMLPGGLFAELQTRI